MRTFEQELREAAARGQLDEALRGIRRIADALGAYRASWGAATITEVCDMLADAARGLREEASYEP